MKQPDKLDAVIAHELAHVARFDDLATLALAAIRVIYPLHPVAWLASGRLNDCREIACDRLVLAQAQVDPASYARLLIEQALSPAPLAPVSGLSRRGRSLKRRLKAMEWSRGTRRASISVFAVGLILVTAQLSPSEIAQSTAPISLESAAEELSSPTVVSKVSPIYPEAARQQGISGNVVLSTVVGIDGRPRDTVVIEGDPTLAQAAIEAIAQWRFEPAHLEGRPVAISYGLTVRFRLE